ncbi:MAG: hypothetical protein JO332_03765 [Planctomycetaceae bacterium]|nr:hypothetical protein [Planctomycetaceae bacterium]
MLGVAQRAVTEAPRTIEEVLAIDCDWTCKAVRDDTYERKSLVRARMYTLEKVPKTGYGALVRIVRPCGGPAEIDALERFEIELKSAVERDGRAILAAIGIGEARAEYLVYARDAATTKTQVPGSAQVDSVDDPSWAQALALIRSLG